MLTAKPIKVFSLGSKRILVCRVPSGNPTDFLDRELSFFAHGRLQGRIHVDGISTASDHKQHEYDFSYTGDEVFPDQLDENAVLTDGGIEDVRQSPVAGTA